MDLNNKKFHHNTPMKYLETYLHIPIVPINLQSPICGNIQRHMVSFKSQVRHRMNSIFSLLPMGITFVSKHLACSPTLLVPPTSAMELRVFWLQLYFIQKVQHLINSHEQKYEIATDRTIEICKLYETALTNV